LIPSPSSGIPHPLNSLHGPFLAVSGIFLKIILDFDNTKAYNIDRHR
jgi:hypothetical protein